MYDSLKHMKHPSEGLFLNWHIHWALSIVSTNWVLQTGVGNRISFWSAVFVWPKQDNWHYSTHEPLHYEKCCTKN